MIDSTESSSDRLNSLPYLKRQSQKLHDIARALPKAAAQSPLGTAASSEPILVLMRRHLAAKHSYPEAALQTGLINSIVQEKKFCVSIASKYAMEQAAEPKFALISLNSRYTSLGLLNFDEAFERLTELTEYYKFHVEVPRIFSEFVGPRISRYHNHKRTIFYNKICARLEHQTGSFA